MRSRNSLDGSPITPGSLSDIDLESPSLARSVIKKDVRRRTTYRRKYHDSERCSRILRLSPRRGKKKSVPRPVLSPSATSTLKIVSKTPASHGRIRLKHETQPEVGFVPPPSCIEKSSPSHTSRQSSKSGFLDQVNTSFRQSLNLCADSEPNALNTPEIQTYAAEHIHAMSPVVHEAHAAHHNTVFQDKRVQEPKIQEANRLDTMRWSIEKVHYVQQDASMKLAPTPNSVTHGTVSFPCETLRRSPIGMAPSHYEEATTPPGAPRKPMSNPHFQSLPHVMATKNILIPSTPPKIPCEVARASTFHRARDHSDKSFNLVLALDYALIGQIVLKGHTSTGFRRALRGEETFVIAHGFAGDIFCDINDRRIVLHGGDYIAMEQDTTFEFYNASSITCTIIIVQSRY